MIKRIVFFLLLPALVFAQDNQQTSFPDNTPIFSTSIPFLESVDRSTPFVGVKPGTIVEAYNVIRPSPRAPVGWTMRRGTLQHNSTAIGADTVNALSYYVNNDFDLQRFMIQYNDTDIRQATNTPPTTGTTFGPSIYTATGASEPAFMEQINEDWVCAADGAAPWGWCGGTAYPDGFYIDHDLAGGDRAYDNGYKDVRNDDSSRYIPFIQDDGDAEAAYIGYRRPIDGFHLYLGSTKNSVEADMTVYYWKDDGSPDWAAVSNLSDGTQSGNATLAQSGEVTWDADPTDETAALLTGTFDHLYWYKVVVDADITDGIKIYQCTVTEDDAASITNLWSGYLVLTLGALISTDDEYTEYTGEVTDGSDANYIELDSFATDSGLYVGFQEPAFGINMKIVATHPNDEAATMTVKYWDAGADSWTSVGTITDGTSDGTSSLAQSGTITWAGTNITEDRRYLGGVSMPLYWYEITWSATLGEDVQVWEISQAEKPGTVPKYNGVIEYNNFAVWWPGDEHNGGVDYSQRGYPHIMNGPYAGTTGNIFGPGEVNAMARLSSYAIVSTKHPYRLYLLQGKTPSRFDSLMISGRVGAIAPKSMVVINDAISLFSSTRVAHAVILLAPDGFYMTDGMTLRNISQPISDYFNTTAPYIEPSAMDDVQAWVNYDEATVHFAVPINTTGTGTQDALNRELVYSYILNEWYDVHVRDTPAACGINLIGSDNKNMTYIGDYDGKVHRTSYGVSDNGTKIKHYVKTASILPLNEKIDDALNYYSKLRAIKIQAKADTTSNAVCGVTVYPDDKTTGVSLGSISLEKAGYGYVTGEKKINQSGHEFAFKFESDLLNATMELYGFTIDYMAVRQE